MVDNNISTPIIATTPSPSSLVEPVRSVTRIANDPLGKLVKASVKAFRDTGTWEEFVATQRGSPDLAGNVGLLKHPAASLLKHLRGRGVPIPMTTPPWTKERLAAALARGPHKSAKEYAEFVCEEFVDFINKKFWTVLPYNEVRDLDNLRLSPLGVVPQRERRPRLIVDLSFHAVN